MHEARRRSPEWRGSFSRIAIGVVLCTSVACGGGGPAPVKGNDGGIDAGWQTGFAAALSAKPLYSLGFLNQGPVLSMDFVSGPAGASCAALTSSMATGGDFWTVGVVVPSTSRGTLRGAGAQRAGPQARLNDAGAATVYLEHSNVDAGLKLVVFASSGIVTISAAPSLAGDQEDGGHLTGSMTYVAFPINPVAVGSCSGHGRREPANLRFAPVRICLEISYRPATADRRVVRRPPRRRAFQSTRPSMPDRAPRCASPARISRLPLARRCKARPTRPEHRGLRSRSGRQSGAGRRPGSARGAEIRS